MIDWRGLGIVYGFLLAILGLAAIQNWGAQRYDTEEPRNSPEDRRDAARIVLLVPLWPLALVAALLYGVGLALFHGVPMLLRDAGVPVPKLRKGSIERGAGQLSNAKTEGGELSSPEE